MTVRTQSPDKTAPQITRATFASELRKLKASSKHLPELFKNFLDIIYRGFCLRRAVLFTSHTKPSRIVSLAMWNSGELSTGVAITIPDEDSLLAELIDTNCTKIISPAIDSPGNFIESRLLLDHPGGALAIYPMFAKITPIGVISLVSNDENAFFCNSDSLKSAIQIFAELTKDHLPHYENLSEI